MYECRFPKLSVRTKPQMFKAVDASTPRRQRPIPIPKLKCDQLTPNLVGFFTPVHVCIRDQYFRVICEPE